MQEARTKRLTTTPTCVKRRFRVATLAPRSWPVGDCAWFRRSCCRWSCVIRLSCPGGWRGSPAGGRWFWHIHTLRSRTLFVVNPKPISERDVRIHARSVRSAASRVCWAMALVGMALIVGERYVPWLYRRYWLDWLCSPFRSRPSRSPVRLLLSPSGGLLAGPSQPAISFDRPGPRSAQ